MSRNANSRRQGRRQQFGGSRRPRGSSRRSRQASRGFLGRRNGIIIGFLVLAALVVSGYFLWPVMGGDPVLAFDKTKVDLGEVRRTQEGTQTYLVSNRGAGSLRIGPASLRIQEGCDQVSLASDSFNVPAGKTERLTINLGRHRQLGHHRVLIDVPSNDPNRPTTTLSMDFVVVEDPVYSGTGPRLRVDKDRINIGKVPYDWPLYEQFTLHNDGDAPLLLRDVPSIRVEEGC